MLRDKLRANLLIKLYLLEVDLRHVSLFHDEVAHAIQDRPSDVLPLVRVKTLHRNPWAS
jgi:DNA replication licensing factor MCM5